MSTVWKMRWLCHILLAVLSKSLCYEEKGEKTFVTGLKGVHADHFQSSCDEANWLVETSVVSYPHKVIRRLIPGWWMDVTCWGMRITRRVTRRIPGRWETWRKIWLSVWLEVRCPNEQIKSLFVQTSKMMNIHMDRNMDNFPYKITITNIHIFKRNCSVFSHMLYSFLVATNAYSFDNISQKFHQSRCYSLIMKKHAQAMDYLVNTGVAVMWH